MVSGGDLGSFGVFMRCPFRRLDPGVEERGERKLTIVFEIMAGSFLRLFLFSPPAILQPSKEGGWLP